MGFLFHSQFYAHNYLMQESLKMTLFWFSLLMEETI